MMTAVYEHQHTEAHREKEIIYRANDLKTEYSSQQDTLP